MEPHTRPTGIGEPRLALVTTRITTKEPAMTLIAASCRLNSTHDWDWMFRALGTLPKTRGLFAARSETPQPPHARDAPFDLTDEALASPTAASSLWGRCASSP